MAEKKHVQEVETGEEVIAKSKRLLGKIQQAYFRRRYCAYLR